MSSYGTIFGGNVHPDFAPREVLVGRKRSSSAGSERDASDASVRKPKFCDNSIKTSKYNMLTFIPV